MWLMKAPKNFEKIAILKQELVRLAPQNDCQNLNFVKDIYVVGEKTVRNGRKIANSKSFIFFHA